MSARTQRRLLRMMVLGLTSAAVAAGGAQATEIPYLSHGQGISDAQLAQLQGAPPSAPSQQVRNPSSPSIAVGGHYLDSNYQAAINNRAASSAEAGGAAAMTAIVDLVEATGGDAGPVRADVGSPASSSDGFSWSDAGVGAGSVLGLVLVAGAGMLGLRRGRKSRLAGA
ncbi:MAG: hypothetical protein LC799_19820 [Actinobacteria bacterium]|nr:hypothetical protein [Actinomycetota bacterium]